MKIIDKVKTIFWDNEDEEMDEVEEISPKKSKEQETEIINERDLFKTETNFKFPVVFTEEDFAKTIPPEKHISTSPRVEKNKIEEAKKQQETSQIKKQEPIKKFKLSPAISPIYGVLDKNYKKEDIKSKPQSMQRAKKDEMSFENIRQKAYGTLSEDLEKTLDENNDLKQEIEEQVEEKINENKNVTIEEAINNYDNLGMVYNNDNNTEEDIIKLKKDKKSILEDTIEQDLFNLIDSMYDKEENDNGIDE